MIRKIRDFWTKNSIKIAVSYSIIILLLLVVPTQGITPTSGTLGLDKMAHSVFFFIHFIVTSVALS